MFTVKKELKLKTGETYDITKYPSDGLFLVDDGTVYLLAIVENGAVMTIPVPREYIVKHKQQIGESGIDLLQKQLAELNKGIIDLRSELDDGLTEAFDEMTRTLSQNSGGSDYDLSDLTKLIAVAQKPELIDKKVN